jgi:hypothetical protein
MAKEVLTITKERYEELAMLVNTNKILEAKIEELLKEILELKKKYDVRSIAHIKSNQS